MGEKLNLSPTWLQSKKRERREKLTWMKNFLSLRVTRTEGTVEFEMIDIVEEGAAN